VVNFVISGLHSYAQESQEIETLKSQHNGVSLNPLSHHTHGNRVQRFCFDVFDVLML